MKASQYLFPTEKDDPQDAVVASHKLMIRAGLVRKTSAGLYSYLPLGLRILKKIEAIVREEMDASGALEFELPILTPSDLWKTSGRWDKMGKEMFRLKDRHEVEACLGPTHEESFCSIMKPMLRSYKDLPLNVYQIHTKFRDEMRPRFGVIRSREFTMKDAYSFHLDDDSLDKTYQTMRKTYRRIFARMGLATIPVQADSGNMGGSASEEFMVVSPIGEESLTICQNCSYSGNIEKTPVLSSKEEKNELGSNVEKNLGSHAPKRIETPGKKSIAEVAEHLNQPFSSILKAVAVVCDKEAILVFMPGNRELNESKLKNITGANEVRPLSLSELVGYGLVPGFIGPHCPPNGKLRMFLDSSVSLNQFYTVGANELDFHETDFSLQSIKGIENWERADLVQAMEGDSCPSCHSPLKIEKGIEVGHIFKLGQKYSKAFEISVLNQQGKASLTTMGCYGIGVNRCMATVIEQCNDDKGISWPISIAPFSVSLVSIVKAEEDKAKVQEIYNGIKKAGIDVFWDDRDVGPGFKFKDSELIGFPIRITIGKGFLEKNEISILIRKTMKEEILLYSGLDGLTSRLMELIYHLKSELNSQLESIHG